MTKTEKAKRKLLDKINSMLGIEMTGAELKWLRGQMESNDADVRDAAETVHRTKLFFFPEYEGIKCAKLTKLEFYAQGKMSDMPPLAEEYRHVRYELKAGGGMAKTVFGGDAEYTDAAESKPVRKKTLESIVKFFVMFLEKLDELFATQIYLPGSTEPGLPRTPARYAETDGCGGDNEPDSETSEIFRVAGNTMARWSLRLTFDNGAQRTVIQDGSYLTEAGLLLGAIDGYFDNDSLSDLEPDREWIGMSEDEVTDWQDL
jgi:hypothetical protein